MSTEIDAINDFETLLDLRIQLKKYKKNGATHTLQILRRIKKANIPREFLFKIKISRTIAKLAKMKFEDPTEDEANILKYSQFLINQWRTRFFNREKFEYDPINYRTKKPESNNGAEKNSTKQSQEQSQANVPKFDCDIRNKGFMGIKKFFKKVEDKSEKEMSEIYVELEKQIFLLSADSDQKTLKDQQQYKSNIKNLCSKLIDTDKGKSYNQKLANDQKYIIELLKK